MALAKNSGASGIISVSPGDVVEYLVRNEPLSHVAEISMRVDARASELRQNLCAMESFDATIEKEKSMAGLIDELLNECRALYLIVSRRVKEAGDVVGIRSQDLRLSISRLRGTPLTTPPVPPPGMNPSIAQVITKAQEIQMAQAMFLRELEMSRDRVIAAFDKLSNRGMSQDLPPSTPAERTGDFSTSVLAQDRSRCVDYGSLWTRYQRLSREFVAGVDKIVKNSETIRELAFVLERNRNVEPAAMPDLGGLPTLAEELLARQTQHPRKIGTLRQNPYPTTAKRVVQILSFEMLKIWMDLAIQEYFDSAYPSMPPWHWIPAFLAILSIIVIKAMHRIGNPTVDNWSTELQTHAASSQSIRDILLGVKTGIPNDLAHNLIPKRL